MTRNYRQEAAEVLRRFNVAPQVVNDFEKNGTVYCSYGVVMAFSELTDEQKATVKEIEDKYNLTVFYVISGVYKLGSGNDSDGDIMNMETYLTWGEEDSLDNDNEELLAYVKNLTDDWCSELGYVLIQGCGGALLRTA